MISSLVCNDCIMLFSLWDIKNVDTSVCVTLVRFIIGSIGGEAKYSWGFLSAKGVACVTGDGAASAVADFIHFCSFCTVRMSR